MVTQPHDARDNPIPAAPHEPLSISPVTLKRLSTRYLTRPAAEPAERVPQRRQPDPPADLAALPSSPQEFSASLELIRQLQREIADLREDLWFVRRELTARRDEAQQQLKIVELQARALGELSAPHKRQLPGAGASWRSRDHWIWAVMALLVVVIATIVVVDRVLEDTSATSPPTADAGYSGTYRLLSWTELEAGLLPASANIDAGELVVDGGRAGWRLTLSMVGDSGQTPATIVCEGRLHDPDGTTTLSLDVSGRAARVEGDWPAPLASQRAVLWLALCGRGLDGFSITPFDVHLEQSSQGQQALVMNGAFSSLVWAKQAP